MMTDEEILKRFDDGSKRFDHIDEQLQGIMSALKELPQMRADIAQAKKDSETVKELVEAWSAVKTGGKFVKWLGPILGGIIAGWAAIKFEIASMVGVVK
jgi:uncharacterized protein (DUF697 family)